LPLCWKNISDNFKFLLDFSSSLADSVSILILLSSAAVELDSIIFLANLQVLNDRLSSMNNYLRFRLDSLERVLRHVYQHLCERNFIPQLENPFPQYVPPPNPENNNDNPDH